MSEQVEESIKADVEAGCRVRVITYCGGSDNKYVGLTGEITEVFFRKDRLMLLVHLDNDPCPQLQAITGGLPCLPEEVEVIDGNSASN